eukprot:6185815-Pleurochrysis_carterae.AAC.4
MTSRPRDPAQSHREGRLASDWRSSSREPDHCVQVLYNMIVVTVTVSRLFRRMFSMRSDPQS